MADLASLHQVMTVPTDVPGVLGTSGVLPAHHAMLGEASSTIVVQWQLGSRDPTDVSLIVSRIVAVKRWMSDLCLLGTFLKENFHHHEDLETLIA